MKQWRSLLLHLIDLQVLIEYLKEEGEQVSMLHLSPITCISETVSLFCVFYQTIDH